MTTILGKISTLHKPKPPDPKRGGGGNSPPTSLGLPEQNQHTATGGVISGRPPGSSGYRLEYTSKGGPGRDTGDTGGGFEGGGGGGGAAGANPLTAASTTLKGANVGALSQLNVEDAVAIAQGAKSTKKQRAKSKGY